MRLHLIVALLAAGLAIGCAAPENATEANVQDNSNPKPPRPLADMPPLNAQERHVIQDKGTERPFTGQYHDHFERGVYLCRQCGAPLYLSESKFKSDCGWPSFDDEIPGAVRRQTDRDGRRTEILCANCGGHLGHVFEGEQYTEKDTRHCVNSLSLQFLSEKDWPLERAVFAGGCFWGVEQQFEQVPGVLEARSGYTGGTVANPTYEQVCAGRTGHAEAVEILYDPSGISYEQLARLFFEIHDPTQVNRQGPDVGTQYRSAAFCANDSQRQTAAKLIDELRALGYNVATKLEPAGVFWPAEGYHQDYMDKHPGRYSCHARVNRFEQPAHLP